MVTPHFVSVQLASQLMQWGANEQFPVVHPVFEVFSKSIRHEDIAAYV